VRGRRHPRPSCHGVARRAKTDAREWKKHGFPAVFTVDAGEPLGEIPAVEILVDHVLDHRLEEGIIVFGFSALIRISSDAGRSSAI